MFRSRSWARISPTMPLNHELCGHGGAVLETTTTAADYRLYALPNTNTAKTRSAARRRRERQRHPRWKSGRWRRRRSDEFTASVPAPLVDRLDQARRRARRYKGFLVEAESRERRPRHFGIRRMANFVAQEIDRIPRIDTGNSLTGRSAVNGPHSGIQVSAITLTWAATTRHPSGTAPPGLQSAVRPCPAKFRGRTSRGDRNTCGHRP